MSLFEIIGAILIGPLKLFFEIIFSIAYDLLQNPGLSVIVLSLAMNILVLPLYRRADAIQIQARDTENKLKDVVTHIKKTFSGDERMMILQTYYRQNNYSPLSVLSGSVSLLLEIPFFMAAYQFLSGVDVFAGTSFGPITDLSVPDGLITLGGFTVNVLPILMTVINMVSSSLYLKGFPLKTKIQMYGMALFFLVFLYNKPAALVFYWTLNNTFSLGKTLFYKIKEKVLEKKEKKQSAPKAEPVPNKKLFIMGGVFLTVLLGGLIPSAYIAASPQEYIDAYQFYHPVWYVVNTLCICAGTFLVWFHVFYWLAKPKGKVIFTRILWVLCGVMLVNYMFFDKLGVVSPELTYETGVGYLLKDQLINIFVILALGAALYFLCVKFSKKLSAVLLVGVLALSGMGIFNTVKIITVTTETVGRLFADNSAMPEFDLSKNGKNVVVIMLDRGMGPFVPYIMEEKPEIKEQFDGFTYYSNTLSYGAYTNFGSPPLYGGYEYTPVNMNLRADQKLSEKHNEALKVVPTLFAEEGYEVSVIDPSYAGYQWIPDISIYNDLDGVSAYRADGRFNNMQSSQQSILARKRNFLFFSVMKAVPLSIQSAIYDEGAYHALPITVTEDITEGVKPAFMDAYNVMLNMNNITNITSDAKNTYMFMRSDITHEDVVLQEPDYTPSNRVDNSAYYPAEGKTITAGDQSYLLDNEYKISHYHINMAAFLQLGNWFDYLRQNGVYDNTRIIIVSDHGRNLEIFDDPDYYMHDIEFYTPLLLVKDFNATGFTTSDAFMTNADVPVLSLEGLIENPVNPYTGNQITSEDKEGVQYVILSDDWDLANNHGYQFLESTWAAVREDIWNKDNWTYYLDPALLPPDIAN